MTHYAGDGKTVARELQVNAIALSDRAASLGIDLLVAQDRDELLRVADHLRLLASQVESFVERMP